MSVFLGLLKIEDPLLKLKTSLNKKTAMHEMTTKSWLSDLNLPSCRLPHPFCSQQNVHFRLLSLLHLISSGRDMSNMGAGIFI